MRRRDILSLAGLALTQAVWPLATRAQQARPAIGLLLGPSETALTSEIAAFGLGLAENGFDSTAVAIDVRSAENDPIAALTLLNDLLKRVPVAIGMSGVAGYPNAAALFMTAAMAGVPVVSVFGSDPQSLGYVDNLAHPGGLLTGVNLMTGELEGKRISLLHDLAPSAKNIAALVTPNALSDAQLADAMNAATRLGLSLSVLRVTTPEAISAAYATMMRAPPDALLVIDSAFFNSQRDQIVPLSESLGVPVIYGFASAAGLMSYGPNLDDVFHQVGQYVGLILKGVRPADLPVVQPTAFDLIVNLRTAKAIGISVPNTILIQATQVVE